MIRKLLQSVVTTFILTILLTESFAQSTQTIRGRIIEEITHTPLVGVNVTITSITDKFTGTATDIDGNFRIENVPVGRHSIKITYVGFEEQTLSNVVVTAGKEVILNIGLVESVNQLSEIVVTADTKEDKTATNNDLAIVSARSFNVDDTKRYAGALGDPSRMAANFAGVVGGDDSRNDIVVRGNSPLGMLWQMEGLNIPNPNHFGALVSTGGPVSMLNNNNLDKSDFMTSAFPAQYGNATAGVFDLRLRDGNNQQKEFLGQVGFNGFEVGAEGPFSSNSKSSYIINYRYSTLGVFEAMGIDFGTGSNVPFYQDINFKLSFPDKKGKWSVFGFGGTSDIDLLGSKADLDAPDGNLYGTENQDAYAGYKTGLAGVSYEGNISASTYFKIASGISSTGERFSADSLVRNGENEVIAQYLQAEAEFRTRKYSLSFYTRTKFSTKNSITSGFYIDAMNFDLFNREVYANMNSDYVRVNVNDNATLYQVYSTWRHRFTGQLSLNMGVHGQYYSLSEQFVAEPRVSVQYVLSAKHAFSFGYGLHNQIQSPYVSFVQTKLPDGTAIMTNRELGFTSSNHYAATYDWNISETLRLKAEAYYQQLNNIPVEQRLSSYGAVNVGASFNPPDTDSLVNAGTGKNMGIELTIERFFSKGYYFLITSSLFDSKYKGSDGIERNTAFNTGYVVNALGGKEWKFGKNGKFFSLNLKLTTIGGKHLTPIDFVRSQQAGRTIFDESRAYSLRQNPYFRMDVKLSYRKEFVRSTLEVSLDLQNATGNKNIFERTYNPRTNQVVTQYQQGFFPVPMMRFTF